jgi:PD-(D/E)XK nuclease superfamily domain
MTVQGGATANYTGSVLEEYISSRLKEKRYAYVQPNRFVPARYLEQPIYTRQFHIAQSIYDTPQYCDFILYHPQKWANNLVIESKWQQTAGSVDEKYPYTMLNIQTKYGTPTIVVLGGGGYKKGAEKWLRSQAGQGNLLFVFSMEQFAAWVNKGNL